MGPPSEPPDPNPAELSGAEGTALLDVNPRVPNTEAMGQGREDGLVGGGRVVWR